MIGKSINYYGYGKETYSECIGMIKAMNRNHIIVINFWFLVVDLLYLIFSALNLFGVNQERIPFYASYLAVSTVFAFLIGLFPKFSEKYSFVFMYANILIMLSYGILVSVAQPYMAATLYLVLLTVITLTYIGTMVQMIITSFLISAIFLYTSYKFKTFSIAYNDTYNIIILQLLVVGLHYLFQRMRIQQFVLHQRNLQIQGELEVKSSFDTLTGLLNRGRFFSIAEEIISQTELNEGSKIAVCLIDLDEFKQINDKLGHQMGDKAIQITGQKILNILGLDQFSGIPVSEWDIKKITCIAGRLGGDEFIALVRFKDGDENVTERFEKLLKNLNEVQLAGMNSGIKASIGITLLNPDERDVDGAYKRADDTLYESKKAGKNQIKIFGESSKNGGLFKRGAQ